MPDSFFRNFPKYWQTRCQKYNLESDAGLLKILVFGLT